MKVYLSRRAHPARRPGVGLLVGVGASAATAWLSLVGGLLFWSSAPRMIGWQPRLVLSGSMGPALQPGDVVLTMRVGRRPPPGAVIAVQDPSHPAGNYLHRLIRYDGEGRLVTKGDANRTEDFPAVTQREVLGEARMVVPIIGRPVLWARQHEMVPLAMFVTATILAAVSAGLRTAAWR